jgi:hypothetical protein
VTGGDAVAKWIDEMTRDCVWQHHLLSVYHVDVAGDHAEALIYHTSHQLFEADLRPCTSWWAGTATS